MRISDWSSDVCSSDLTCLALSGLLPAADQTGNEVEAEVDAALLHLAERGALGSFDQPLTIARPAQVRYELGAVVDVRKPDPRGLEVPADTPDGAAARRRSDEHTAEPQSLKRNSYAAFCWQ